MKILEKIIEYSLYFFVFFLPWQSRLIFNLGKINGGYSEYENYSLYFTDIILIFLLLSFSFWFFKIKNVKTSNYNLQFLQSKHFLFILSILDLFIFISCFFAYDRFLAFYKYFWFLLSVALLFLIIKFPYQKIKLFYFFIGGVFLEALLGIYQFIFQTSFANKYLGIAFHNSGDLGVSVIETLNGERWLRAYGGLDHPNILGGLLVIAILFLLIQKKNSFKFFIDYIILFIFLTSLFLTFSRSAYLAFIFSLFSVLFFSFYKKDKEMFFKSLKFIFLSFLIFINLFLIYPQLFKTRILGHTRLENKSNIERVSGFRDAQKIIKNNLFLGVGFGNYSLALRNELYPHKKSYFYQPVHNVFLLILAEIGIFGFISFLFFLFYVFFESAKNDIYNLSFLVALIILFSFDHYFFSLHFGILLFFFVLAIVSKRDVQ